MGTMSQSSQDGTFVPYLATNRIPAMTRTSQLLQTNHTVKRPKRSGRLGMDTLANLAHTFTLVRTGQGMYPVQNISANQESLTRSISALRLDIFALVLLLLLTSVS